MRPDDISASALPLVATAEDVGAPVADNEAVTSESPAVDELGPGRLAAVRDAVRWTLCVQQPSDEPGQVALRFPNGTVRQVPRLLTSMSWVERGSLLHLVAADPEGTRHQFEEAPADVVVHLLRDVRTPMNKADIERRLADLHLPPRPDWWTSVSRQLKAHPHVVTDAARYVWSEAPIDKSAAKTRSKPSRKRSGPVTTSRIEPADDALTDELVGEQPVELPRESAVDPAASGHTVEAAMGKDRPVATHPKTSDASPPLSAKAAMAALRQVLNRLGTPDGSASDLRALLACVQNDPAVTPAVVSLAGALLVAIPDPARLDLTEVDLPGLDSSLRRDVGRFSLRVQAFPAAVSAVIAADPEDAERLLAKAPLDNPAMINAWSAQLARLNDLDVRHADRTEVLLRQVSAELVDPDEATDFPSSVVLLLAQLSRSALKTSSKGLMIASRHAFADCLRSPSLAQGLRPVPKELLIALSLSRILRDGASASPVQIEWLKVLDQAARADVLSTPGVWAGVGLTALVEHPALSEILQRRELTGKIAVPILTDAVDSPRPRDLLRLMALPDALLGTVSPHALAAQIEAVSESNTPLGKVLQLFRTRLVDAAEHSLADRSAENSRVLQVQLDESRSALEVEKSDHERVRKQLHALQEDARDAEEQALKQARVQSLRLAVEILEEHRLAALAAPDQALDPLQRRLLLLAEAEGLKVEGSADEVVAFSPSRHRILGEGASVAEGARVVVVRPAYVLSHPGGTTVLRYGEVRPARD